MEGSRIWLLDSILDGAGGVAIGAAGTPPTNGPALWIERSSVLGPCYVHQIDSATEALFAGQVTTLHRQTGAACRFRLCAAGDRPRRAAIAASPIWRSRTEIALQPQGRGQSDAGARRRRSPRRWHPTPPAFTGCCAMASPPMRRPARRCPRQIAQGKREDGSEMGAYCHLKQAQRLSNLRLRMQEYLPFGREPAIVLVT